jgi:hypothetical protein
MRAAIGAIVIWIANTRAVTERTVVTLTVAAANKSVGAGDTSNGAVTTSKVGVAWALGARDQRAEGPNSTR